MRCKRQESSGRRYKIEDDICMSDRRKASPHDLLLALEKIVPQDPESFRRLQVLKSCVNGSVNELKAVLEACPNPRDLVNSQDLSGCTALHVAARFNQPEVADILITYGTDCNKITSSSSTPLKVACRYQSEDVIRLLLKNGSNPLLKLPKGGNVLHIIALFASLKIAELVFSGDIKPPVNTVDELGMTPLHNAAQAGKEDICLWLIKHGANPRAKDDRHTTPLMVASRLGHVSVMRTLLGAYGAGFLNKTRILIDVDDEGMGPLHHAVLSGRYQAVQELLICGADPNARTSQLMTPLHMSALTGGAQLVPLLTSYQANMSLQDDKGKTPLHRAVELRNYEVISALLMQGADPDIQDNNYRTPLLVACHANYVEAAMILCDYGADMTTANMYGQTCLHIATDVGNMEISRFLLERCGEKSDLLERVDLFNQTIMHLAAKLTDVQFVDALINRGCSATAKDIAERYPLHVAARYGCYEVVLKLAEVTPDINAQCVDGKSALFTACESGNLITVRALLNMGANIKDTDFQFKNCLIAAAMEGFTDIVEDLIKRGVPVNHKDKERNTAMHYACLHGQLATVKTLLKHGASVSDMNIHEQTPLDMAVDKSNSDVAVTLMEHDSWEESLSVTKKKGRYTFNRMIENTPAAVKVVLDNCVKTSDNACTDESFAIEFNYKYINPGYHCTSDSENVFVLGFILCVAMYYFMMPRPHDKGYTCWTGVTGQHNHTHGTHFSEEVSRLTEVYHQTRFSKDSMHTIERILYSFMAAQFIKDIYACFVIGRRYIISVQFIFSSIISCLLLFATLPPGFEPCDMQWRAISYALFGFFLKTSLIFQRLDGIGVFFVMFMQVVKTVMKISCMMLFFILAFAIPFSVMVNQDGFTNEFLAVASTFAMALGELNFKDNFVIADNSPFNMDIAVMFPSCCIILNCCLMNLMIGVAVGDINKVEKQAYLTRLKTQISFLRETENILSFGRKFYPWQTKLVVRPNSKSKSFKQRFTRVIMCSQQINFIKKPVDHSILVEQNTALAKEMAAQKASIDKLTTTTDHILDILQKMNSACRTVTGDEITVETPASIKEFKAPILVKEATMTDIDV